MRKLVACLACRNQGRRLSGKPLQNLDIENSITILDYIISAVRTFPQVSDIVLGISEGVENQIYQRIALERGLKFITGSQDASCQR